MVDPVTAIGNFFKNYVNFNGRSTRAEYWWAYLFQVIINILLLIIEISLFGIQHTKTTLSNGATVQNATLNETLTILFGLATLLPALAVTIRRLHDTGHSGWWLFISFVPLIGGIWFLILLASQSSSTGWGQPTNSARTSYGPTALPRQYY